MTPPDTLFTRSPDLPAGLAGDRWVAWKPRASQKVPIGRNGRHCDPSHPRNWLPLDEARHVSRVFGDSGARIGYALSGSGLVALDFDRVIHKNSGEIAPEVRAHLDSFDTYVELSPSGLGLHLIVAADLSTGNRRIPGMELLTSGFVTVTGHPLKRGPIAPGGEALQRIVRALPASSSDAKSARTLSLPTPLPGMVRDLIAQAMPNARFRKLLHGDWSEYQSQSEADAAFCMHLARNGGDLVCIVAALRQSGLSRPKLRRDDYVFRTALFAVSKADVRLPHGRGVRFTTDPDTLAQARQLLAHSSLASEAPLLLHLADNIATRVAAGETPDPDGYWRVSPAILAGDYPESTQRLMSRQACWKRLRRLAEIGTFSARLGVGTVLINGRTRTGKVTLIQILGTDMLSIVDGFLRRASDPSHPPVYVVSTNAYPKSGENVVVLKRKGKAASQRSA